MAKQAREFDVVVYGATGFTGQLACEYMHHTVLLARENERIKPETRLFGMQPREFLHRGTGYAKKLGDLRWAIAGRDVAKLNAIKAQFDSCAGVIVADSGNVQSVEEMVRRTKVLLSFAGPFTLYGTPIVEACAKFGTHYCDSTGELPWVQMLMKQYHDQAVANNALIVPMCGFDCIPCDLGVLYAVTKLRERGSTSIASAKTYSNMVGSMSGGTMATVLLMETKYKEILDNPFNLGGGPENKEHLQQALDSQKDARFAPEVGQWTAPFVMENMNTRVVRRSAHDLGYRAPGKGGFRYSECSLAGTEAKAQRMAVQIPPEKRQQLVNEGKLPKPGEGPSFASRRKAWFQTLVNAKADDGKELWISISGAECGYEDTSLMCCEAALCLALEDAALPKQGGVYTTSVAFGSTLIERLDRAGMRFRVVGSGDVKYAIRSQL